MGKFHKILGSNEKKYLYLDKDTGEEIELDRNEHYHVIGGLKVKIYCQRCGEEYDSMKFQGYCEECYDKIQSMKSEFNGDRRIDGRTVLLVRKFCESKPDEHESCSRFNGGICGMIEDKLNREIPCPLIRYKYNEIFH